MSPDLRELLHAAAPRPGTGGVDPASIARRARRIGRIRIASAMVVVAAAAVVAAASVDGTSEREPVVGDPRPRPAPAPTEIEVRRRKQHVPPGPRHELASGTYGADWDRDRAGKRWRLLVWGDETTTCWQLAEEGEPRSSNRSCSSGHRPATTAETALGGSVSFFTGSRDPAEYQFVVGEAGPEVDRLVFDGARGPRLPIPLHAPPRATGIPFRYYAALLPLHDYGRLVALGDDGRVLATHRLCGAGCIEDRERAEQAEVAAYEGAPVTQASAAATFAHAALGQAGLLDQFGTFWGYRAIEASGDGYVARFRAARCFGAPRRGNRCSPVSEPAWVRVGVAGGRFVVEGAEGTMTPDQRDALESYSEDVPDDVRAWRLVTYEFDPGPGDEWDLGVVMVWTGNMAAPRGYGSTCRLEVFGEDGALLYESRDLPFLVGGEELRRVAALLTEVTAERTPEALGVECDAPHADALE